MKSPILASALLAAFATVAPAADNGVIDNPPQGGRPYIFLTSSRLAELQDKVAANDPLWTRFSAQLEAFNYASPYFWHIPEYMAANALAYAVTGSTVYRDRARGLFDQWDGQDCYSSPDGLCYQWTGRYISWSYDWVQGGLSPAERTAWRDHVKAAAMFWYNHADLADNGHQGYTSGITFRDSDHALWIIENLLYAGLACFGDDNAAAESLLEAHDRARAHVTEAHYLGDYFKGGFDPLGPMYGAPNSSHLCRPLIVDKEARGIPSPPNAIDNFARFYIHTTFPQYKGTLQLGDVHTTNYQPSQWTQEWTTSQDQMAFMSMAAGAADTAAVRNHAAYWVQRQEQVWSGGPYPFQVNHLWNKTPTYLESFLFMPAVAAPMPPADAGESTTFVAEGGMVAMRTSWNDDAVCLWFTNTDWNVDHTHQDALNYTILRNNMPVNSELSGYWGAEYPSCYHAAAHNTLMIECGAGNNFTFAGRSGGNQWMAMPGPGGRLQNGTTTLAPPYSDGDFGYVEGDAAANFNYLGWNGVNSNGEINAESATRKIAWIKPDTFVLYDYVKTPDALGPRWRRQINHFHGEPIAIGPAYRAQSDGNAYFFAPLLPAGADVSVHADATLFTATGSSDFLNDQKHWTMIVDTGAVPGANEFLSVQYVAADTETAIPGHAVLHTADGSMTGALIDRFGDSFAVLMKKGPGTVAAGAYTLPAPGNQPVEHFLANVPPGQPLHIVATAEAARAPGDVTISFAAAPSSGSTAVIASAAGTVRFATVGTQVNPGAAAVDGWHIY